MRPTLGIIAAALACACSACSYTLANIRVQVFPGGHGSFSHDIVHPHRVEADRKIDADPMFKGFARMAEIDGKTRVIVGLFPSLDKVNIGDIQFSYEGDESASMVRVTIPVSKSARWYRELGFTASDESAAQTIHELMSSYGEDKFSELPLTIKIEIALPGRFEAYRLTPTEEELGWRLGLDSGEDSTLTLTIRAQDLPEQGGVTAGLTVRCGPASESLRARGKRFKELLPK